MRTSRLAGGALGGLAAALLLPGAALAQTEAVDPQQAIPKIVSELNSTWVILAAVLVMFMQAGFLFLEIGFSRGKNVGSGVAKILVNFSIATIVWWAVGFGIAFGGAGLIAGDSGFFASIGSTISEDSLVPGEFTGASAAFMIFQFMFCAVSLAIVWGTTLERIRFIAYVVFAIVFAGVIYPLVAHWGFGGGCSPASGRRAGLRRLLGRAPHGRHGRAGRAAAARAAQGQVRPGRPPTRHPGPLDADVRLGVFILWLGWFGFNAGSTLGTDSERFAEVAMVTQLGAAGGVVGAPSSSPCSPRSSTSAWRATARSPAWSPSPLPPATWSCGRRRSSASSAA
jgi:Amt family ammonium transporter